MPDVPRKSDGHGISGCEDLRVTYAPPPQQFYPPPPVRRRRRRWPWVLLTVVIVLIGLFVAADRIALHIAENKAADTLQSSQHLNTKPDVSVAGFPFLTQLIAGEFDEVTISAHDLQVRNTDLTLAAVVVHLHHVTVPHDYSSVRARTADATGTITYAQLSQALHVPVHDAGNGRLEARPTVQVHGRSYTGTVSAVPQASAQSGISFRDPKLQVGGTQLPSAAAHALVRVFATEISLAGLPFHIRVTGATVAPAGLTIALTGRDLVYTG